MATKHKKSIVTIVYGDELSYDTNKTYSMTEFISALNYYNYTCNHENIKNFVLEYADIYRTAEEYGILADLNKTSFKATTGAMCRMHKLNFPFSEKQLIQIKDQIDQLLELAKLKAGKPVSTTTISKKKVDVLDTVILDIDIHIDYCVTKSKFTKFKAEEYITKHKINYVVSQQVAEYYRGRIDTIGDKEGYNGKMYEQYLNYLNEIVNTFSTFKKKRKERTKKVVVVAVDPSK